MWSAALTSWLCLQFIILVSSDDYMIFDPSPVQQFTLPKTARQVKQPSSFGLSLSLRNTSILIDAPVKYGYEQAPGHISNSGSVYECDLHKKDQCTEYPIVESKNNRQLGFTGAPELHAAIIVRFKLCISSAV